MAGLCLRAGFTGAVTHAEAIPSPFPLPCLAKIPQPFLTGPVAPIVVPPHQQRTLCRAAFSPKGSG